MKQRKPRILRWARYFLGAVLCFLVLQIAACENKSFECWADADCQPGQMCTLGWCQSAGQEACQADGTCSEKQYCHKGVCIEFGNPPTCQQEKDCKRGYICTQGICRKACHRLAEAQRALLGKTCTFKNNDCKGVYVCSKEQKLQCVVDGEAKEVCDDKDNDCDGQIDEDFLDKGEPCSEGIGECKRDGVYTCKEDGTGVRCGALEGELKQEVCDGKDNDCDGQIDEELDGVVEVCDGKDNDCDGKVDGDLVGCATTFAGTAPGGNVGSGSGTKDGPRETARFAGIADLIFDKAGNLYVADADRLRKIDTKGIVSTIAGGTGRCLRDKENRYTCKDGPALEAQFVSPSALAFDGIGNLYIADSSRIRKLDTKGMVTTVAGDGKCKAPCDQDGPALEAQFKTPSSLAFDSTGNLFFCDKGNHKIRKLDTKGMVTTVSGDGRCRSLPGSSERLDCHRDGPLAQAQFDAPSDLTFDKMGNLFVLDWNGLRKIDKSGMVTTFPRLKGEFLAFAPTGTLYLADLGQIYKVHEAGEAQHIAGSQKLGNADGPAKDAQFLVISGITCDQAGNLYIASRYGFHIKRIRWR